MDQETPKRKRGRPVRHGHKGSPTYIVWAGMKQSVRNPKATMFPYIGARGISYTPRWERFDEFLADMGEKPDNATLQRKDKSIGFFPDNCYWEVPTTETET